SVGSPVPTHTISLSLGSTATAPIDCTGCLSKTESKVTPLSPVLNKPPVASPTKNTAGLRGSIAMSDTRPPIAAGPIDRALKFLKRTSVNFGGVAAGAGEKPGLDELSAGGLDVAVAAVSGVGEVEGRVPESVAMVSLDRDSPRQVVNESVQAT